MKAAVLSSVRQTPGAFLRIGDVPRPRLEAGYVLLRVVACGVCRTDLHIVEGDLPPIKQQLIPGHQMVGEVMEGATATLPLGTRVGVSWLGGATVIAGTVITEWKTYVTSLPSLDIA
jgi:propanol-preferring alcohol dehydrogenase